MPCLYPRTVRVKNKLGEINYIQVPCGKCYACQQTKSLEFAFRLYQEVNHSMNAYFVTLTYEDSNLSFALNEESGEMQPCLVKKDLQDFFKRLRQYCTRQIDKEMKLKYFACGEYGFKFHRPHYHFILCSSNILLNVEQALEACEKSWNLGFVEIKPAHQNNIHYVTGYVTEKLMETQDIRFRESEFIPIVPEFRLLSNNLGLSYVDEFRQYHLADRSRFFCNYNGHKINMPRYYRERLYNPTDRALHNLRVQQETDNKFKPIEEDLEEFRLYEKKKRASEREFIRRKRAQILKRKSHNG